MTVSGAELAALLERRGFDFFAGVPCSLIEDLIATLEGHPRLPYIPAPREDVAVGLAAGAWFAGRRPAVLMQNSGLGTSLNALTSLYLIYKTPCLLIVSWRGHGGVDAPEHLVMGEVCTKILETIGIPYRVFSSERAEEDVEWAAKTMHQEKIPAALMIKKGILG